MNNLFVHSPWYEDVKNIINDQYGYYGSSNFALFIEILIKPDNFTYLAGTMFFHRAEKTEQLMESCEELDKSMLQIGKLRQEVSMVEGKYTQSC